MNYLEELKKAQNRKELAKLLGYKPKTLTAIIYKIPESAKYTSFDIPKKSGGVRSIKAPVPKLKKLQQHLANYLYNCLAEIDENRTSSPVSYGFRKGGTISDHAKNHRRRRFVLNLDLEDFFPSLHFGRVRGFFLKDFNFMLQEEVATTIAQIACDGKALPQGSPCSPIISELICQILDLRLLRFAKKHGVRYSRYADDLTFSTNQKQFPEALAVHDTPNSSTWSLGKELSDKIINSGFTINQSKTRVQVRGSRQEVTGLIVNEKVNVRRKYYRRARAMCDSLFHSGNYFKEQSPLPTKITELCTLEGILSYIYMITQSEEKRSIQDQRQEPRAIRVLYRRFLFFKYCVILNKPLIITEGKTDPVYLREAIRSRTSFHPKLGKPKKDGFSFAFSFFDYENNAHELMDLGGGSGDLRSIPLDYKRNLLTEKKKRRPFSFVPLDFPVIILLDNDSGLSPVAATIKTNFGLHITKNSTSDFYHVTHNLYLVKTPEKPSDTCIEDFFPAKWKAIKLNKKKFNAASNIDPKTEYGKEVFAKRVIKPNAHKIDFSDFDQLLNRLEAVLDDYASKKMQVKTIAPVVNPP